MCGEKFSLLTSNAKCGKKERAHQVTAPIESIQNKIFIILQVNEVRNMAK